MKFNLSVGFLLLSLTTPLSATSFNGVVTINNISETKYQPLTETRAKVLYTLKAAEYHSQKNLNMFLDGLNKTKAKEVLNYRQGLFSFDNSKLYFEQAFYYKGELYLDKVSGQLGEHKVSAPQLVINLQKRQLSAKQIMMNKNNRIQSKINFYYSFGSLFDFHDQLNCINPTP
ncbi:hypothetical protein [Shewanella fidelis]|uniref:Uncharacterized protein n=1 Tax=Shewanella fidelis TaxID=173509 RepID=A0AAW8NIA2_9GAMM|nr:hypothetical protein [Shewanella fidelis]MDR8522246.1 hypothetical protein [Shewanella fidelis]MDW4812538.1 hypothetical protein [Shewanella fidelis]MDW4816285.1 hypothetical protein [Shewanella fidelis]MDW4820779.1 hypothetical protein [Shewanella fidelis]MDW4825001.1 hypothetical protein [Shewanella fidelis]